MPDHASSLIADADAAWIAAALVDWHAAHQRELPWRTAPAGGRDAYAVWIAEMMLQQTRVAVVEAYYRRWMTRFPNVQRLAAAELAEVLKLWEGLGYYARARNLHRAAQRIVADHAGVLPASRDALLALPGIGAYSAGAILSIAYGQREPLLDGNVRRVLARLADYAQPVDQPTAQPSLWDAARLLVAVAPDGAVGAMNEGLMELGALVCTPRAPRCDICPLQARCRAFARGTQAVRPVRTARKQTPHYDVAAGVIWQGDPFKSLLLIAQRPADGLLGGLWEFPGGKREPADVDLAATLRREITEELGMEIEVGAAVATVSHAFTHFRITLHAFHARHIDGEPQPIGVAAFRWIEHAALAQFPMGKADRTIAERLLSTPPA